MKNDFHAKPFDESTRVKLALFERYFAKWLPVFLHRIPQPSQINVVDFFSGPGEDIEHTPGSPQLILDQMRIFRSQLGPWKGRIHVVFNDAVQKKAKRLEELIEQRFEDVKEYVQVSVQCKEFANLFEALQPQLAEKGAANILFVDQSGVRELPEKTFLSIVDLEMTDLLFFVSSSTVSRFHDLEEIKRLLPIPEETIQTTEYYRIHKLVRQHYESLVPPRKEYYMGDFSLKKGPNIYGVIFGSGHLRGLDKFVSTCWELDKITGEANYSIDREQIDSSALYLFPQIPSKISLFQQTLETLIKGGRLSTNRAVLEYYLRNGMLCRHAKPVLQKLIAEGFIEKSVAISYSVAGRGTARRIMLRTQGDSSEPNKD